MYLENKYTLVEKAAIYYFKFLRYSYIIRYSYINGKELTPESGDREYFK